MVGEQPFCILLQTLDHKMVHNLQYHLAVDLLTTTRDHLAVCSLTTCRCHSCACYFTQKTVNMSALQPLMGLQDSASLTCCQQCQHWHFLSLHFLHSHLNVDAAPSPMSMLIPALNTVLRCQVRNVFCCGSLGMNYTKLSQFVLGEIGQLDPVT